MRLPVIIALITCACSNKSDEGRAKVAIGHLSCSKLVAPAIVAKYLEGYSVKESAQDGALFCIYAKDDNQNEFSFRCDDSVPATMNDKLETAKKAGNTEFPGIGRAAVGSLELGILAFWDDDTPCLVQLTVFGTAIGKNPLPFAKDLADSLTPASLR
jgi:hypothetical protein